MKISGFTYIRNGQTYGYPYIPSISSLLPIVDELIVVVGDSTDETRISIEELNNPKIKIIDVIWDDAKRENGSIFAEQSNIGLKACSGDWLIHLQADEVLHEKDYECILNSISYANNNPEIEGILFPFYHFWGDFNHIRNTRRVHPFEIRAFKKNPSIYSYKDSQGFRKYPLNKNSSNHPGTKLNVIKTDAHVYHYSYARHPYLMKKKDNYFHRFWHDDNWLKQLPKEDLFDFNEVDRLEIFNDSHPKTMSKVIEEKNWEFNYDPTSSNMKLKDKLIHFINKTTGRRWFEYKNYKMIR